jgi:hypothetical protein
MFCCILPFVFPLPHSSLPPYVAPASLLCTCISGTDVTTVYMLKIAIQKTGLSQTRSMIDQG